MARLDEILDLLDVLSEDITLAGRLLKSIVSTADRVSPLNVLKARELLSRVADRTRDCIGVEDNQISNKLMFLVLNTAHIRIELSRRGVVFSEADIRPVEIVTHDPAVVVRDSL